MKFALCCPPALQTYQELSTSRTSREALEREYHVPQLQMQLLDELGLLGATSGIVLLALTQNCPEMGDTQKNTSLSLSISLSIYLSIYLYTYIYIDIDWTI